MIQQILTIKNRVGHIVLEIGRCSVARLCLVPVSHSLGTSDHVILCYNSYPLPEVKGCFILDIMDLIPVVIVSCPQCISDEVSDYFILISSNDEP